ncbi:type I iodothyronine deiodinase-like [Strongylocentrotus purpuratus]|uniref:Iodothyronine deiodinase n=1 Tax=Strongylocentrotus purpuratus TaxID=7668 RepID=A0A7M7HMF2_STRPU|nr:type I iodothyronine deiodinase-like [Strongylocentrotus purpuratus]|eukprot:XP_011672924.1 PREDICTED: type I iodothyronine deiodinase-like [Strongylocentrotus purpuratus]
MGRVLRAIRPLVSHLLNKKACVIGGTLATLVSDYRTQVDFVAVYLAEAHAEGAWEMGHNISYIKDHTSLQERIEAAKDLLKVDATSHNCLTDDVTDTSKFRLVVDKMDSLFTRMFRVHPDRVIFIRDGKMVYIGNSILGQIQNPTYLMTHEARDWLEANVGSAAAANQ